jgi:glycosyltransferase involved in cell wall biosynthesis
VRADDAPASGETYRKRVRAGLLAATAVVTLTEAGRADLRREYGVDATQTIHNGRSDDWVRPMPKEPFVLGAGRLWDEAKNLRALESAAMHLDWPVLLAGEPPADRIHSIRRGPEHPLHLGSEHRGVRLLGALSFEDLAGWMARAAVFASPAKYEPFGLSALEAALCGCALVLGDTGTAREVWGDRALFVDPNDARALHRALQELCQAPVRCVELGARAQERARELTAARMADGYADLYRSLLVETAGER